MIGMVLVMRFVVASAGAAVLIVMFIETEVSCAGALGLCGAAKEGFSQAVMRKSEVKQRYQDCGSLFHNTGFRVCDRARYPSFHYTTF